MGTFRYTVGSILLVVLPSLAMPHQVSATSIIAQPWQAIVGTADLVGVVECVTAGEIVARYRIVDSWKGPPVGTEITVRGAVSIWEPILPAVLCGERYLIAAQEWRPVYRIWVGMGAGPGGGIPMWWRDDRADFVIPSPLNVVSIPPQPPLGEESHPLSPMTSDHRDLGSFRKDALALFAEPEEQREASILRALVEWHLFGGRSGLSSEQSPGQIESLRVQLRATSVDSIVHALLEFGRASRSALVITVLGSGGGAKTYEYISKLPESADPRFRSMIRVLKEIIGGRIEATQIEKPAEATGASQAPTEEQLREMRAALDGDWGSREFQVAFENLSRYDCEYMARFLAHWVQPKGNVFDENAGYGIGSYFAWKCTGDRKRWLRMLGDAKDPFIRVAGGIYLCFEDKREGMQLLEDLSQLPGDPGAWAALSRARWGDKKMIPRAVEVFATGSGVTVAGVVHRQLQKRLLVLLSNSAKKSGVPQPGRFSRFMFNQDDLQLQIYDRHMNWWRTYGARTKLHDPTLEASIAAHID